MEKSGKRLITGTIVVFLAFAFMLAVNVEYAVADEMPNYEGTSSLATMPEAVVIDDAQDMIAQADENNVAPFKLKVVHYQSGARAMLAQVNALRAEEGASALTWNSELEQAAMLRAAECCILFDHTRPSGQDCFTVSDLASGENIAMNMGVSNPGDYAFQGWVASPGHHANMVNKSFKSTAIACAAIAINGMPMYFFVQLFSYDDGDGMKGRAYDKIAEHIIPVPSDCVDSIKLNASNVDVSVDYYAELPRVQVSFNEGHADFNFSLAETQECGPQYLDWSQEGEYAAIVADGLTTLRVKGVKVGTTKLTAKFPGGKASASLTVEVGEWTRLAGDTALETMYEIIGSGGFEQDGTVLLASLDGYWDALTAAGLAGLYSAPVIMTSTNELSYEAYLAILKLKPTKIIVCGGTGSVSDDVMQAAKKAAGDSASIVRYAGSTATKTAVDIFQHGSGWSDTAIIATVGTFQDALAAAPLAYANKMPIFLAEYDWETGKGTLSDATLAAMKKGGIKKAYIAGGEYWVSKDAEKQLAANKINLVKRLSGKTAVETSGAIAKEAIAMFGMSTDGLGVATTSSYYDALAGAAFCGIYKSVLVLVTDEKSSVIADLVKPNAAKIENGFVFGGTGSVSKAVMEALKKASK